MILIFDLDDTLYEELSYVRSGFRAVANYFSDVIKVDKDTLYDELYKQVLISRNNVFDIVFSKYRKVTKANIKSIVSVYRRHIPKITLYPDAARCLERFKDYKKYIVTDGNKEVQYKKYLYLDIYTQINKVFISHRYGIENIKPSPYIFLKLSEKLKVLPSDIIYIGDNPNKDFIGIKPFGFKTVRVNRGMFHNIFLSDAHEAHITINTLDELTPDLLKRLSSL